MSRMTRGAGQDSVLQSPGMEETARIRYSTNELRPKLRAALENEYSNGRISEPVYRATLGAAFPAASGGVSCNFGSGGPQTGRPGSSGGSLLGDSERIAAGKFESERVEGCGSAQSEPGSLDPQSQPKAPNPIKSFLSDETGTSMVGALLPRRWTFARSDSSDAQGGALCH